MFAIRLLSEGGGGPDTALVWILWILLGVFALAVAVGWLSSLGKPEQARAESKPAAVRVESATDDLVVIEGIGPKVAKVLARAGIRTFEDLAHAKSSDLRKALDQAGMQMMDPEGWIDQAKLAARGDWAALEKLKGKLRGGRKKK